MGPRDFFEFSFQPWVCFGVGYKNWKGTERPHELNIYLPFSMVSFAW